MTKKGEVKPIESEQLVILKNAVAMAKYDLSRNQQKVFLEIAMMAKNAPTEKFYKLYIREFLKNIGVSTNDTTELKREIEEMRNITIHIPKTKRGGDLKANFFASVEIFEDQSSRYVEIELSEKLKPYFIEIAEGEFFHYQIQNTRVLKSSHSIRMYLYLKAWKWTGKILVKYDELREILGVREGDYKLFGDFKRRVLDKCQEELKSKTDIAFEYTLIRERPNNPNTPVHKISFLIFENGKTPAIIEVAIPPQIVIPFTTEPDIELLKMAHGIEKIETEDLTALIDKYSRDRVFDVLLLAQEEIGKGNKIRSLTAYLHNALKNKSAQGKASQKQQQVNQATVVKVHKEIEKVIHDGISLFKQHYFIELGNSAPQDVKDAFWAKVKQSIDKREIKRDLIFDGETPKADVLRELLGHELNTLTEHQLNLNYMKSLGKPVIHDKGFWKYA